MGSSPFCCNYKQTDEHAKDYAAPEIHKTPKRNTEEILVIARRHTKDVVKI